VKEIVMKMESKIEGGKAKKEQKERKGKENKGHSFNR